MPEVHTDICQWHQAFWPIPHACPFDSKTSLVSSYAHSTRGVISYKGDHTSSDISPFVLANAGEHLTSCRGVVRVSTGILASVNGMNDLEMALGELGSWMRQPSPLKT